MFFCPSTVLLRLNPRFVLVAGFAGIRLHKSSRLGRLPSSINVEPLVRHKVATKKITHLAGLGRPLVTDDANALELGMIRSLPIVEHVIDFPVKPVGYWFGRPCV